MPEERTAPPEPESSGPPPEGYCEADLARLRSLTCIKWTHHDADVIPAWVADMDFAPPPVAVDAVRALVDRGDFGYNFAAHAKVPEALAAWQLRRHGWSLDPKHVRLQCDVMQAVELAVWLNTGPGDGVVLFTPVYHPFFPAIESTGRRVVECPLTTPGWRIDPERLASAIDDTTRVILTCNPHNPTGRVFDAEELAAIAEVAEARDLVVISDEIWADIVHPGAKHVPFASVSEAAAARTVTITAASKTFNLAGLCCAVAHIGHAGTAEAIAKLPGHVLGRPGTPGAEATLAAWTQGQPWLDVVSAHLTAQRDHLAARLAAELPQVGFEMPEATYLAWLDFREAGLGDKPAKVLLKDARVGLSGGLDFGPRGAGFARLNFATSRELLDEMVDRIGRVVGG